MKVLFAEARLKSRVIDRIDLNPIASKLADLKIKKVGLGASIQYLDLLGKLAEKLEREGIRTYSSKGTKTSYNSQVIGCDVNALLDAESKADAFILISDGRFHALNLAVKTLKPVFVLNLSGFSKVDGGEIKRVLGRKKASKTIFLGGKSIGIIVSAKPGQESMKRAILLKEKLEKAGKKAFIFLTNTINIYELENFSCDAWVNTACPGMELDSSRIINLEDAEMLSRDFRQEKV